MFAFENSRSIRADPVEEVHEVDSTSTCLMHTPVENLWSRSASERVENDKGKELGYAMISRSESNLESESVASGRIDVLWVYFRIRTPTVSEKSSLRSSIRRTPTFHY